MTEPPVCVPRASGQRPVATAAADPLDDPPGVCPRSLGLRVGGGANRKIDVTEEPDAEAAEGDEKKKLEELREKLLDYVNEVDRQLEERYKESQAFVEQLL